MSEQRTYEIEATEGIDYLVLDNGEDIQEIFERYKNDEAGEYLKKADAKLISWEVVN